MIDREEFMWMNLFNDKNDFKRKLCLLLNYYVPSFVHGDILTRCSSQAQVEFCVHTIHIH